MPEMGAYALEDLFAVRRDYAEAIGREVENSFFGVGRVVARLIDEDFVRIIHDKPSLSRLAPQVISDLLRW